MTIPMQQPAEIFVEDEVKKLSRLPIAALRVRWQELFNCAPPKAFGPDLLRRSIAQRLQEQEFGALSKSTVRHIHELIKKLGQNAEGGTAGAARLKPGTVLRRDWKGARYEVTVHEDKYLYAGRAYSNLSEIARSITGTRWNGPRFFGLRRSPQKSPSSAKGAQGDIAVDA